MSSVIWYLYEFARKTWLEGFTDAKSQHDIVEKPDRFRDFPEVLKEYCIGCGACTSSCPSPHAIKLVREEDCEENEGITYPVINNRACIRCGFCAEVCPTDPKTLLCGENHLIREEFNIIPSKRQYLIDDFLCIKCKKCMKSCPVDAIEEVDNKIHVNQAKCISCGDCLEACPVKGAMKGVFIDNLEDQKAIIRLVVNTLEEYIENKEEELQNLPDEKLLKLQLPLSKIWDKALEILPDEEIALEIIENATDRLKINIITWDESKCNKCRLCVDECPTGAINYDEESNKVSRDPNKCLRCSNCYQTCPFCVVRYFVAKFLLDEIDGEKIILITLKESKLANNRND
ncbi:NAD(P)H-quinone oxidoreductase subunit I, chloroplastic [Methanobrevibacter cuticularis]|uniref:NAD(P)H-quinone oxidoreductase subunit I, chloroplastic n=1 Tax=Methanobrevibacter cuticularis TaxID=47311 RepID=A0A166EF72_9EURY|nr:4Fe-4S binding protein [Methanobrevibacter cuticularis]KZX16581.1 NAD(P)H-quinone oxidoreductase subunit I, chloroplastic [Methanobrevibacter cuticularis]